MLLITGTSQVSKKEKKKKAEPLQTGFTSGLYTSDAFTVAPTTKLLRETIKSSLSPTLIFPSPLTLLLPLERGHVIFEVIIEKKCHVKKKLTRIL